MTTSTLWRVSMQSAATPPLSSQETIRWMRIGILAALAMLLSYLESFIPIPLPGVKLGLANIPILVALAEGDVRGAFFVGIIKVVAASLLFGNPVTFAYSAAGTLLAFCLMAPLSRLQTMRIEMVSIVGALAHEAGQLMVAQALLGTPLVWYSAPIMAVAGCITGLLCGVGANRLAQVLKSEHQQPIRDARSPKQAVAQPPVAAAEPRTIAILLVYLAFVVLAMHLRHLVPLACCLGAALPVCLATGVSLRSLGLAFAPTVPIALITVLAQIASNQQGPPAAIVGPIAITWPALEMSACMLARLAAITAASLALVHLVSAKQLVACAHAVTQPLRAMGVETAGPELALATTLQLLPLLSGTIEHAQEQGLSVFDRTFWTATLPELAAELYQSAEELAVMQG